MEKTLLKGQMIQVVEFLDGKTDKRFLAKFSHIDEDGDYVFDLDENKTGSYRLTVGKNCFPKYSYCVHKIGSYEELKYEQGSLNGVLNLVNFIL